MPSPMIGYHRQKSVSLEQLPESFHATNGLSRHPSSLTASLTMQQVAAGSPPHDTGLHSSWSGSVGSHIRKLWKKPASEGGGAGGLLDRKGSMPGSLISSGHSSYISLYNFSEQTALQQISTYRLSTHISEWPGEIVSLWLQWELGLGEQVAAAFQRNVKNSKTLLTLKDGELKASLCMDKQSERTRLMTHVNFLKNLPTDMSQIDPSKKNLLEMNCDWVCSSFLDFIGLPKLRGAFTRQRIDGVYLQGCTQTQMGKLSSSGGANDNHPLNSLFCGWTLMKQFGYDKKRLEKRVWESNSSDIDPVVWSNSRVRKWISDKHSPHQASRLVDKGVHGAWMVLDADWCTDHLFRLMELKKSKENEPIRSQLKQELDNLLKEPRQQAAQMQSNT